MTHKVKAITEALGWHSFSASTISQINKSFKASLARFAQRRLEEGYLLPMRGKVSSAISSLSFFSKRLSAS